MRKFLRVTLPVIAGTMLVVIGTPMVSSAITVPEIDLTTGTAAGALLAGAVLVIRGLRKQ